MGGNARGGDDTLIGSGGAFLNVLDGDAGGMGGNARGGDDTLTLGVVLSLCMATPSLCTTTPAAATTR